MHDTRKYQAVVHYICDKASANPSVLGAIKLNKVLWYSDTVNYKIHGKSITGEVYVKRQHGPVPKNILRLIDSLVEGGVIARGKVDHFGFLKNEYIAIKDADLSLLSAEEVSLIDAAFEHVCLNHTAKSVSAETHGRIWQLAEMGEEMPYFTVFASDLGEVDEQDVEWANQQILAA